MERLPLDLGDLVEHWRLVGKERDLVAAKNYDTQLGFALLLKFYGRFGRFPRGRRPDRSGRPAADPLITPWSR